MRYKYIFSRTLAYYLLVSGFAQVDMYQHDSKPNTTVYVFIASPQLKAAIKKFYK